MRNFFVEMVWARAARRVGWLLVYFGIFTLVVTSIIEVFLTSAGIVRGIGDVKRYLLAAALAAALVPAAGVVFWGCRAIMGQLRPLVGRWGDPVMGTTTLASFPVARTLLKRSAGSGLWMGAAFGAALILGVVVLALMGAGERSTAIALRLTGRLSLLLFWPAYAGSAMAVLFGSRFAVLARHGRDFGLAFASAQFVHLGLVGWHAWISHQPVVEAAMPFFAIGILWTGVLALSSVKRLHNVLGHELWRILRAVGLEYIALVFFADFVIGPIQGGVTHPIEYVPFSILIIVGPLLRVAAMVRRLGLGAKVPIFPVSPN
jgi:hypothetical protein